MIDELKPLIGKLSIFAKEKMGFQHPPKLFLKNDQTNAKTALGKTAHYDPAQESVTLFITNRHPKDILRSLAHELVHHTQNLRGDLTPEKMSNMGKNYAQDNKHMRNMEKEAYLVGNMCFRDWEDSLSDEDAKKYKLAESKYLKENKRMANKLTKEMLKKTIRRILIEEQDNETELEETEEIEGEVVEEEVEELEEKKNCCPKGTPGCPGPGKRGKDDPKGAHKGLFKSEGLEEKKSKKKKRKPDYIDIDGDGDREESMKKAAADKKKKKKKANESKIQTPEQENTLYEQRFTPKNNRLFEKLLKEWTK